MSVTIHMSTSRGIRPGMIFEESVIADAPTPFLPFVLEGGLTAFSPTHGYHRVVRVAALKNVTPNAIRKARACH